MTNISDWMRAFTNPNSTLTCNGHTFSLKDCSKIGEGGEKSVYKINGQNLCFFVPRMGRFDTINWLNHISSEKQLLDQIIKLGFKTQQFKIVPLTAATPDGRSYTMDVLLAQDLNHLCESESLVIYDQKIGQISAKEDNRIFGKAPNFYALRERFTDQAFVRSMLQDIVHEYVLAQTFQLPIKTATRYLDDSAHLCFQSAENPDIPPVAHYIFWDVTKDFAGIQAPLVPSLQQLKDEMNDLARDIAVAIEIMASPEVAETGQDYRTAKDTLFNMAEVNIKYVLNNDETILEEALISARKSAIDFITHCYLCDNPPQDNSIDEINRLILASDLSAIKRFLFSTKCSSETHLSKNRIKTYLDMAQSSQQPAIIEFFKSLQTQQTVVYLCAAISTTELDVIQKVLESETGTIMLSCAEIKTVIDAYQQQQANITPVIMTYLEAAIERVSISTVDIREEQATPSSVTLNHTPDNSSFFMALMCNDTAKNIGYVLLIAGLLTLCVGIGNIPLTAVGSVAVITSAAIFACRFFAAPDNEPLVKHTPLTAAI